MATSVQVGKVKQPTLLRFFIITASMIMAIYEYPTFATSGFPLVFFLLLGGTLWFIPMRLCITEMATVDGWEGGDAFVWTSSTLGLGWGLTAISFGYLQTTVGFISILYFVLGTFSYILKWPVLNEDPITKAIAALIILWALALAQSGGAKYMTRATKTGSFAGTLLPTFISIALTAIYPHSGIPIAIEMDSKIFFPDSSKVGTLIIFVTFTLSYAGIEASATHINKISSSGHNHPLAMLLLMVAAIYLSSIGSLSIAMAIPDNEINLSAGVTRIFTVLMSHVAPGIEWTVRVISVLLLLGILTEVASWIIGPSRGVCVTAQENPLPAAFVKMNKNGIPITLVVSQLVITSIALIILINTGGGNSMSFLITLALMMVIYLCVCFMLFIDCIMLTLRHPDLEHTFNILGGKRMKLVVTIVGLLTSIMTFTVLFLSPDSAQGGSTDMCTRLLIVSFLVVLTLPFALYAVRNRGGKANAGVTLEPVNSQNAPRDHSSPHPRVRSPHYIVTNDKKH